jgi:hypothetical protein
VTDSRTTGQEAGTVQFQRLQRVRARQRSRRRWRLIAVLTPPAVVLAGAGVVMFVAILGATLERVLEARAPAWADTTTPPSLSTPGMEPATTAVSPPAAEATPPPSRRVDVASPAAARIAARPSTPRAAVPDTATVPRGAPAPPDAEDDEAAPSARAERGEAEAADPATAIEWLLNGPRGR